MKNFTFSVVLGLVGLFACSAMGQAPLKIYFESLDSARSPVSGKVTSVSVDPADPVTVYRVTAGDYQLASDAAIEPVGVAAGQTIRLRIATVNNRGHRLLKTSTPISYAAPCSVTPEPPALEDPTPTLTLTGVVSDTAFSWKSDPSWTGTCRVIIFELTDRWEYAIKVRFN